MKTLHLSIIICICVSIATGIIFSLNPQSATSTVHKQDHSEINTFAADCTPQGPGETMPVYQWLEGKQVLTPKEALLAGQPVLMPKYFPAGYGIKKIAVAEERITFLISKLPINSTLTNFNFIYQDRGISMVFDNVPPYQEANEIRQPEHQPKWKLVDINGRKGLGHEIIRSSDPQSHGCLEAEFIFYTGNSTRINLSGIAPLEELVKMAKSLS